MLSANGNLNLTLQTIRDLLGDHEARELPKQVEMDKGGRAFLAAAHEKSKTKDEERGRERRRERDRTRDPPRRVKADAPSSTWNERHARCRYCGGPHWNRECNKRVGQQGRAHRR
eukprot:1593711-Pleurochrysis_carterae.AAC.1